MKRQRNKTESKCYSRSAPAAKRAIKRCRWPDKGHKPWPWKRQSPESRHVGLDWIRMQDFWSCSRFGSRNEA